MNKKCIALLVKRDDRAIKKAVAVERWLTEHDIDVVYADGFAQTLPRDDVFCIVVLGGDGTFLSAARLTRTRDIPLMGVKFGEVGFLAETLEGKLYKALEALLEGKFYIEERMRLKVCVIRENGESSTASVLNDLVLNRGALSRLAYSAVYLNGSYLTTFKADGLIVATPTGSTAYSLAAGGPVIHPTVPGIILTPICPFTLTNRPLIIPDNTEIEIQLEGDASDIVLTFDGQEGLTVDSKDRIVITKGQYPVKMISFSKDNYYNVLKARLLWSGGRG
ncbi:MAG: NAD(+)/NADH kinase [Desulfamplus sp.]|nr:NAD(+)/NADH kinase [Desulfamplus sp.]MBF0412577.1 NAD(+)/NADH kinase [Desulfamplus sp.]